jgi:hypothetical protein
MLNHYHYLVIAVDSLMARKLTVGRQYKVGSMFTFYLLSGKLWEDSVNVNACPVKQGKDRAKSAASQFDHFFNFKDNLSSDSGRLSA